MRRPDGVLVPLDGPPLLVAGRLVQEDLCLLERPDGQRARPDRRDPLLSVELDAREKLGHGLARIHLPVDRYDETVARRVQRLFDALRPEAPLMRANLLLYSDGDLFNPRPEFARHAPAEGGARFVRVERQVLLRLPVTRAVVFSIHTYMVRPDALDPAQRATPRRAPARRVRRLTDVRVFVLTGAGVSAESGLGTFRDKGGIWARFDPMQLATPEAFARDPARCTASTTCAGGTCSRRSPTPRTSPWRGSRRGWRSAAAASFSAPRTSTTCTSGPAAARSTTCTASC